MGEDYFAIKERYKISEMSKMLGVGRQKIDRYIADGLIREDEIRRKDNGKIKDVSIAALIRLYENKYGPENKRLRILKALTKMAAEKSLEERVGDEEEPAEVIGERYLLAKTIAKVLGMAPNSIYRLLKGEEGTKKVGNRLYGSLSTTQRLLEDKIAKLKRGGRDDSTLRENLRKLKAGEYQDELGGTVVNLVDVPGERSPKQKVLERISIDIRLHYR